MYGKSMLAAVTKAERPLFFFPKRKLPPFPWEELSLWKEKASPSFQRESFPPFLWRIFLNVRKEQPLLSQVKVAPFIWGWEGDLPLISKKESLSQREVVPPSFLSKGFPLSLGEASPRDRRSCPLFPGKRVLK